MCRNSRAHLWLCFVFVCASAIYVRLAFADAGFDVGSLVLRSQVPSWKKTKPAGLRLAFEELFSNLESSYAFETTLAAAAHDLVCSAQRRPMQRTKNMLFG